MDDATTRTSTEAPDAPVMPPGVLEGGWEYVWAAFFATWLIFLAYFVSLLLRRPWHPVENPR